MTLARHEAGHTEQVSNGPVRAACQRRPLGARLHDGNPAGSHAVPIEGGSGCPTRDDDQLHRGQRAALALLEAPGDMGLDTRFGGERVVHKSNEPQPSGFMPHFVGHHAEREPVDEHGAGIGNRGECLRSIEPRRRRRLWKTVVQLTHNHRPAETAEACNHLPVVRVAARQRVEAPRHQQEERAHSASGPSKDAQATCDSCSVTRRLASSVAPGPRSPRRTAATSRRIRHGREIPSSYSFRRTPARRRDCES